VRCSVFLAFRVGLTLAAGLLVSAAQAQGRLNLGLEPDANHHQPLALWTAHLPPGSQLAFDSVVFRQGRGSLRLTVPAREDGPRRAFVSTDVVPLDSVRGRLVTVSAWVRTRNWLGRVGLSASATTLTVAGLSPELAVTLDSLPATTDWRRIEVRLPVKATAFTFGLAIQARGSGQLWVDEVQLRVGGRLLPEGPVTATEALLLPPAQALASNWDFERPLPRAALPDPAGATAALDSASPQHGRHYLRLVRRSAATKPAPTAYLGTLRLARQEGGKVLRVAGYWRQPGARPASPAAAPTFVSRLLRTKLREGGAWQADTLGAAPPLPAPGPEWTPFAFEVPMQLKLYNDAPDEWAALTLSLALPGPGAVELDNLTFALNGQPYLPTGPPTPPLPTTAEAAWLRTALKPLRLATPATEAADLATLGNLVGTARLVGLGEVTHGSHEIFTFRTKLTRYLLEQKGFAGLALEASPLGCAALNDYLHTGQGNPAQLLAALDGWNTTEMLTLVRELRAYHQAHPAAPLVLAGLDIQQPEQALASLGKLVEADDDFATSRLRQLGRLLAAYPHPALDDPDLRHHPDQPQDSLLGPLHRLLAELTSGLDARAKLRARPVSLTQLARQRYYLRLLEQGATWRRLSFGLAFNYRQACLAENAQYLSQQEGLAGAPARLVLWASNTAVAKALTLEERPMGEWLRATLGPGYAALGLALGQGRFAALGPAGKWASTPLATASAGSYEAWLRIAPGAANWLALGRQELTDDNAWLFQQQLLREVGYRAAHNEFMLHSLRNEFDAIVFWRDSTPVNFLP
jgi:erythromycin esterase-like protein